jgi:hypothetical protein
MPGPGDYLVRQLPDDPSRFEVHRFNLGEMEFFPDQESAIRHAVTGAKLNGFSAYLRTPDGWVPLPV